jgi:hypothetical protein
MLVIEACMKECPIMTRTAREFQMPVGTIGRGGTSAADAMVDHPPLPYRAVAPALIRCAGTTVDLLAHRRIRLPQERIGMRLRFADGTSARVYRETVVDGAARANPCVLVVGFRLRMLRGWGHAVFRWESLLNTPLFVGFPGFVSKLWLAHDAHGTYRGVYEWDGPERADSYARSLWRVLALGSAPNSIHYRVLPGLRRDQLLQAPQLADAIAPADATAWWRLVSVS